MREDIEKAVKILADDGVIAYPTDTAYGLGGLARSLKAVNNVFEIKGRSTANQVSVAVASLKQAREIAIFNPAALKLWRAFMPGALTIVLPIKSELLKKKNWRLLTAGGKRIGLRMPANQITLKLLKKAGSPLTATSANVSGQTTPYTAEEIERQYQKKKLKPDFILNGGKLKKGRLSTVVDCFPDAVKVLREGSVKNKEIFNALKF